MKRNIFYIFLACFITLNGQNNLGFTNLFDATKNDNIACYRIPSMVTAVNGDLIVAIDERVPSCGDLKYNKDINIVLRRSLDNGKTWLPIQRVADLPFGKSASDPSMVVDKITGDIFMFYNFMDVVNEKDIYYFHVIKSTDNGKTWSQPKDITKEITKRKWENDFKFITSGRAIQTTSGWLMHTIVNLKHGVFIFFSKNHGKTWRLRKKSVGKIDEAKLIQLSNGNLMVNARVNKKGSRGVFESFNKGKSWKEQNQQQQLIDPSCNASIIKTNYKGKKVLIFSNPKSDEKRQNLTVRISYDDGKTWSKGKKIYKGSAAYSTLTVLKNGKIGLFFEKDDYTKNVFTSFSLDWLTR